MGPGPSRSPDAHRPFLKNVQHGLCTKSQASLDHRSWQVLLTLWKLSLQALGPQDGRQGSSWENPWQGENMPRAELPGHLPTSHHRQPGSKRKGPMTESSPQVTDAGTNLAARDEPSSWKTRDKRPATDLRQRGPATPHDPLPRGESPGGRCLCQGRGSGAGMRRPRRRCGV